MNNIWIEYRFGDLISDIYKGKALNKADLTSTDNKVDGVRYITRTSANNGCEFLALKQDIPKGYIEPGNAISIGDTTATCFYQDEDFIVGDHMVIVRASWMKPLIALYVVTILTNEQYKYSYGRAFLMDRIKKTIIKLPSIKADEGYIPDWQYMEDYMKTLHHKPLTTKNKLGQTADLNVQNWKSFNIQRTPTQSGLFVIENCKCGSAGELDDGVDINYIGAKKTDNGVMRSVALDEKLVSRGHGIMFICDGEGSVGYTNYMDKDFIGSTTTSIGYDESLNKANAMFLVTVLDNEKFKYSYGRKYRAHLIESKIYLPIKHNNDGTPYFDVTNKYSEEGYVPDWKFMERYIKSLPYGDRL